jgi:hypothetical protein
MNSLLLTILSRLPFFPVRPSMPRSFPGQIIQWNTVRMFRFLAEKLSLNELYSFGYDSVAGVGPVAGDYRVGKEENALINYKRGILSMGLLFDEQEGNTLATQSNKTQRFGAGTQIDLDKRQAVRCISIPRSQNQQHRQSILVFVLDRGTVPADTRFHRIVGHLLSGG